MDFPQPTQVQDQPVTQPAPIQTPPQTPNSQALIYFLIGIIGFLVIILAYVVTRQSPKDDPITPTPTSQPTITTTTTPTAQITQTTTPTISGTASITTTPGATVKIYMFSSAKFNEPGATDYTTSVNRMTTRNDVAAFGIEEIIKGPTASEQSSLSLSPTFGDGKQIWFTSNSTCNGKDFTVSITNKDATVRFCRNTSLAGDSSAYVINQQISKTLKQFSSITRVRILNASGTCLDNMSGLSADQCWIQ